MSEVDIKDLVFRCLQLAESGGTAAIEKFCDSHPEQAEEIRRRLGKLDELGLMEHAVGPDFPKSVGGYRMLERLGDGGMGVVFRARQVGLDRDVALKIIRPDQVLFDSARERFRREVEAVARLRHPGIVPIHSVGEENGMPFFVMELIEGRSLDAIIRELAERPPHALRGEDLLRAAGGTEPTPGFDGSWANACAHVVQQVAAALDHAHGEGVLHRDVKPSNVILTPHGQAILLDFGLARSEGMETMTQEGAMLGTIQYMAPEHFRDEEIDARADVYSLAVTFYELLTLKPAYQGRSTEHLRESILRGLRTSIRGMNSSVSWEAETVCLVAADVDPARRYQTAGEFADDLARLRARLPILARRPGAVLRSRRWVQRHPTTTVALVLGLVLAIALPVILLVKEIETGEKVLRERDMALKAIEGLLVQIGAETLDDVPRVEVIRNDILEDALVLYDEMLGRTPDDPRLRLAASRAHLSVAETRAELGRQDDARSALAKALDLVEPLIRAEPTDRSLMALQSRCIVSLADLDQDALRHEESRLLYERAAAIRREILERHPGDVRARVRLAFVRTKLAGAVDSLGRHEEAQAMFEDILREEEILRDAPTDLGEVVTEIYNRFGTIARKLGQTDVAEEYLRKAYLWQEKLVAANPERGRLRMNLSELYRTYGGLLNILGRAEEAIERQRMAVALTERLTLDFPRLTNYRNRHARALFSLAAAEQRRGRLDDAERLYRQALAQHERTLEAQEGKPDFRRQRAQTLVNLANVLEQRGEIDEAEEMLVEAIKTFSALADQFPEQFMNLVGLEDACQKMSDLLVRAGDREDGIDYLRQAVLHSREVVRLLPAAPHRRSNLAGTLHNLAMLADGDETLQLATEALQLQHSAHRDLPDDPQVASFLRNHVTLVVQHLWAQQDFDTAVKHIDEYAAAREADGPSQWLACAMYAGTLQRLGLRQDALHRRAKSGLVSALERGRDLDYISPELIRSTGQFLQDFANDPEISAALP